MWLPSYRKTRADADLAEINRDNARRELNDRAISQKICVFTSAVKKRVGSHDVEFSEEELSSILLPDQALRLPFALELLRKEGRASKADTPGYWQID